MSDRHQTASSLYAPPIRAGHDNKLCGRQPQYAPSRVILTLKVVSEPRVTWATSVPILVIICLSVLDLGLMYATDVRRQTDVRQTDVRQDYRLMPRVGGGA